MAESTFFCKVVGAATAMALEAGMAVLAAGWLTVLPPAGRYLGLRADDFDGFITDRAIRLLDLIEDAIGKPVQGRDSEEVKQAFRGSLARHVQTMA